MASYIEKCSNLHYGLTLVQTRQLAYQYAKKLELNYPPTWETKKEAGVDWLEKFRNRHPDISLRKPENNSAARSFGFNKTAVNEFYDLLESLLVRFKFPPNRIYFIDDTESQQS